jgi:hypothetical protein
MSAGRWPPVYSEDDMSIAVDALGLGFCPIGLNRYCPLAALWAAHVLDAGFLEPRAHPDPQNESEGFRASASTPPVPLRRPALITLRALLDSGPAPSRIRLIVFVISHRCPALHFLHEHPAGVLSQSSGCGCSGAPGRQRAAKSPRSPRSTRRGPWRIAISRPPPRWQ